MCAAVLVAQRDRVVASGRANLICAWFVVDRSGSMAGSRWRLTQSGVRNCLNQLTNNDFVGILTFNDKVQVIDAGQKSSINVSKFYSLSPSGGTALYDAIAKSISLAIPFHLNMTKMAAESGASGLIGVISYLIVLTDGEDVSSSLSLSDTVEVLSAVNRLQNFKVLLAGVGLSGSAQASMQRLGNVGDADIEFRNLRSDRDISDLFEHVSLQLRLQRETHILAVGTRPSSSTAQIQPIHRRGPRCALTLQENQRSRSQASSSSTSSSTQTISKSTVMIIQRGGYGWKPDSSARRCTYCSMYFTLTRRRHHCRICGHIFCGLHSEITFVRAGVRVRVCPPCYRKLV